MRLFKETNDLGWRFNPWRNFIWVLGLLNLITGCFGISIVPFTRKDFGERYLGWINLFFGYTVIANFAFLGNLIGAAAGGKFSFLMTLCWLAFIGASFYHRREIARKNKAGEEWHSFSMGSSILPLPFSEEKIYKVIEPALVFITGIALFSFAHIVGIWLMISGVSLLVNNHLVYYFEREKVLDVRDAYIESRFMAKALAGRPARETAGLVIAESNIRMVRQDPGLQQAFGNLSSEMKGLFDAEPEFGDGKEVTHVKR